MKPYPLYLNILYQKKISDLDLGPLEVCLRGAPQQCPGTTLAEREDERPVGLRVPFNPLAQTTLGHKH